MNFETFKNNVEQWSLARGIYAYSTHEVQLLILRCLRTLAESQGHTLEECCKHARNEIKDRHEKMVEGVRVKEEL